MLVSRACVYPKGFAEVYTSIPGTSSGVFASFWKQTLCQIQMLSLFVTRFELSSHSYSDKYSKIEKGSLKISSEIFRKWEKIAYQA